jgi:hypothetical protein
MTGRVPLRSDFTQARSRPQSGGAFASHLASTSSEAPFATIGIDLAASAAARVGYPCSVFSGEPKQDVEEKQGMTPGCCS